MSSARSFEHFADQVGLSLEPFQRKIARAAFGSERELLVLLPRGNGKTTLAAALAVHHVLTVASPAVYVAAASRDQARVMYEAARTFAQHPSVADDLTMRHLELRVAGGFLRVLASDARLAHGLTPSLVLVDELHAHRDAELYNALRTAMLKRPGSKMLTISTAESGPDTPLGQLRTRALALPEVRCAGFLTDAQGPHLRMLDWSVPGDADVDDPRVVKKANPASWITAEGLAEQRGAVPLRPFARYHANQVVSAEGHWLPAGAWQACAGDAHIEPGERVWIGVDVGGERSASAVVWVTEDLRVQAAIYHGDEAVLDCAEKVRELAGEYEVAEVVHDPWRFVQAALELERAGLLVVAFPQSSARMIPASERLYKAVIERRLAHPNDPALNRHVAAAIARDTPRGWRLDKAHRSAQVDGVVALAMAVERAEAKHEPVRLLGWL